ncbi:hypothetical protein N5S79_23065 [Escherichia coli]|nr:hypothetical protein [Escherichia coli]
MAVRPEITQHSLVRWLINSVQTWRIWQASASVALLAVFLDMWRYDVFLEAEERILVPDGVRQL